MNDEEFHIERIKKFVENTDYDSLDENGKEIYDVAVLLLKKLGDS